MIKGQSSSGTEETSVEVTATATSTKGSEGVLQSIKSIGLNLQMEWRVLRNLPVKVQSSPEESSKSVQAPIIPDGYDEACVNFRNIEAMSYAETEKALKKALDRLVYLNDYNNYKRSRYDKLSF